MPSRLSLDTLNEMVWRRNIPMNQPRAKSKMRMIAYHPVKVFDPVMKMASQARFQIRLSRDAYACRFALVHQSFQRVPKVKWHAYGSKIGPLVSFQNLLKQCNNI